MGTWNWIFRDIQLLSSLTELISCKNSSDYSNEEFTNIIRNLEVYKNVCFRQAKTVNKIALVCMIFVAACVYVSGHESITGPLCIETIFAMTVIGIYYSISSNRIYASFSLLGFLIF